MAQQPNFMDVDIGHQRSMSKEAAMRELEDMNQASNPLQFQGECFWWLRQLVLRVFLIWVVANRFTKQSSLR